MKRKKAKKRAETKTERGSQKIPAQLTPKIRDYLAFRNRYDSVMNMFIYYAITLMLLGSPIAYGCITLQKSPYLFHFILLFMLLLNQFGPSLVLGMSEFTLPGKMEFHRIRGVWSSWEGNRPGTGIDRIDFKEPPGWGFREGETYSVEYVTVSNTLSSHFYILASNKHPDLTEQISHGLMDTFPRCHIFAVFVLFLFLLFFDLVVMKLLPVTLPDYALMTLSILYWWQFDFKKRKKILSGFS